MQAKDEIDENSVSVSVNEEAAALEQEAEGEAGEEEENEEELPFPKATIVNMVRQYIEPGKQIKGTVKREMNIWLGKMVERVTQKMNEHPYSYIDLAMFREAIEPYENLQDIEIEKERIMHELYAIKAACDVLINEVDRKFRK